MKVKKAKWLVILMVVAMLLAMVPAVGASAGIPDPQYTLWRDQDTRVGNVTVWSDQNNLYVRINVDVDGVEGWWLSESHVHVGIDVSDFPLTPSGNPMIGHFKYKDKYDPPMKTATIEIPLRDLPNDWDQGLLIAVQAVVVMMDGCTIICDDTAWAGNCRYQVGSWPSNFFNDKGNWATYIIYPPEYY